MIHNRHIIIGVSRQFVRPDLAVQGNLQAGTAGSVNRERLILPASTGCVSAFGFLMAWFLSTLEAVFAASIASAAVLMGFIKSYNAREWRPKTLKDKELHFVLALKPRAFYQLVGYSDAPYCPGRVRRSTRVSLNPDRGALRSLFKFQKNELPAFLSISRAPPRIPCHSYQISLAKKTTMSENSQLVS
ncbi:hypothetical protein BJX64DRAFT_63811 [Aspergillus heterothallicus]